MPVPNVFVSIFRASQILIHLHAGRNQAAASSLQCLLIVTALPLTGVYSSYQISLLFSNVNR